MWKNLLELFVPNHCIGCAKTLFGGERVLCMSCYHDLDFIPTNEQAVHELIQHQLYGKIALKKACGLLYYDKDKGITQKLVKSLKYRGREDIGDFLAELSWEKFKNTSLFDEVDFICCVPLHRRKAKKRGYNQLHRYGKKISELSGIPFQMDLLKRNIHDESQTTKNLLNRSIAKKDKFSFRPNLVDANANLLVIDDVITTGSTMEQIMKAIRQHHLGELSVLCMASTYHT